MSSPFQPAKQLEPFAKQFIAIRRMTRTVVSRACSKQAGRERGRAGKEAAKEEEKACPTNRPQTKGRQLLNLDLLLVIF